MKTLKMWQGSIGELLFGEKSGNFVFEKISAINSVSVII